MSLLLIDVSAAQGHIDWVRVARWVGPNGERVSGAIFKATQGNDFEDPQCAPNALGAAAVDLLLGFYHFADPDLVHASDAAAEAKHFVAVAVQCGFAPGQQLLMLDIEQARKIHAGPEFAAWVLAFCETIVTLTGTRPVIYTGGPFWNSETAGTAATTLAALAAFPLVIAAYVTAGALRRFIPTGWADWFLWQESGDQAARDCTSLHVDGIGVGQVNVDRDVYRGTRDDLAAFVASLVVPPHDTEPAPAPSPDDVPTNPGTPTAKSQPRMNAVTDTPAHPIGWADRAEMEADLAEKR